MLIKVSDSKYVKQFFSRFEPGSFGLPKYNNIDIIYIYKQWFIMENPIKMDDLGVPLFLGNTHIPEMVMSPMVNFIEIFSSSWFPAAAASYPSTFSIGYNNIVV